MNPVFSRSIRDLIVFNSDLSWLARLLASAVASTSHASTLARNRSVHSSGNVANCTLRFTSA